MPSSQNSGVLATKQRTGILVLVMVLIASLVSGCSTVGPDGKTDGERIMDDLSEWMLTGGGVARANAQLAGQQGNPKGAVGWNALAETQQNSYDRETALRAAREGRPQVNVYQQRPELSEEKRAIATLDDSDLGKCYIITCNYFEDFNRDGRLQLDEFRGLKKRFSTKEQIRVFFSGSRVLPAETVSYTLFGPNGQVLKKANRNRVPAGNMFDCYEPGELREGEYTEVFYKNGNFLGKVDFSVGDK